MSDVSSASDFFMSILREKEKNSMAKKIKRIISLALAPLLLMSAFALMTSCNKKAKDGEGRVYYLNFKPEQDKAWQNLAKLYTEIGRAHV